MSDYTPIHTDEQNAVFLVRLTEVLVKHLARNSGGPVEVSPYDLARLLMLARKEKP
jgi:hypothetical protein